MRIESTADPVVCAGAVQVGLMGVISHDNAGVFSRGSNLIGRGTNGTGLITYNPGPADSYTQ